MNVVSKAPRPIVIKETKQVVKKKKEQKSTVKVEEEKKAPLTEDELIEKIIKGEG